MVGVTSSEKKIKRKSSNLSRVDLLIILGHSVKFQYKSRDYSSSELLSKSGLRLSSCLTEKHSHKIESITRTFPLSDDSFLMIVKKKQNFRTEVSKSIFYGKFSTSFTPFKPYHHENYECELTVFAESRNEGSIDCFRVERTSQHVWYAFWAEKERNQDYKIVCREAKHPQDI